MNKWQWEDMSDRIQVKEDNTRGNEPPTMEGARNGLSLLWSFRRGRVEQMTYFCQAVIGRSGYSKKSMFFHLKLE